MNYLEVYEFLRERLGPVPNFSVNGHSDPGEDEVPDVTPIHCGSYRELKTKIFAEREDDQRIEYTADIYHTLATMMAVALSTTTTGGQLGLRVLGPPGAVKSTLAECMTCCRELIYARSKFTGIVSGWTNLRKSQNLAAKMNGKCLLIKDADPMMQLQNLKQIQSELRDALGDGVIRFEYRTGREFEIHTLFTCIMCGTSVLRHMDDALLGARFLDISVHERGSDTTKIVRRAIKSQFSTIASQLSGGVSYNRNDPNKNRKQLILNVAPYIVGFMLHKSDQIKKGIQIKPLTPGQEERIHAMGDLVSFMRTKPRKGPDREIMFRPERELGTRLGEQFTRLAIFLAVSLQEGSPKIDDEEFHVIRKILLDTCEGYPLDIVKILYNHGSLSHFDIRTNLTEDFDLDLSGTTIYNVISDLKSTGVVCEDKRVANVHGRGQKTIIYKLTDEFRGLCDKVGLAT